MNQGIFQFNNNIIDEIINFTTSSFDLLFISGKKGSAKRETIEEALGNIENDSLIFQHFCFENTVIDDFLLNFYDALRNFSLAQRISLKKFAGDDFKEKVSHYFKTLGENCLIIIENFEKVQDNVEIIDFLSHLAGYFNVKIIVLTTNSDKNLFRFKQIKMKTLDIKQYSIEEFAIRLKELNEEPDEELKNKFYEITGGLELYLRMGIKYCTTTEVALKDLISEFERKETDFEEFMVLKFVSLIPNNYQELLRTFCVINHPVSKEFLYNYELGKTENIDYLSKNFLISFFKDEMYVKDYFKPYITRTFSIQQKSNYYETLIDIYENELTKSPRDRLLRLSRESIRKEIEKAGSLIPAINSKKSTPFSYLGLEGNWQSQPAKQKSKLSEKFNKIQERRKALSNKDKELLINKRLKETDQKSLIEENKEKNRLFIIELINKAKELSSNYRYQDSNAELKRAEELDYYGEFKIEILMLMAKNYKALSSFEFALECYKKAHTSACETSNSRRCEIELLMASCDKNLFKIEDAKNAYRKIANNSSNKDKFRAIALIELAELEEASSELERAVEHYLDALDYSHFDKTLVSKIYYKLAVLYDENGDNLNAIEYYKKNFEEGPNRYYSVSLTNLALIFTEQSDYLQASNYLKLALKFDSENNDFENMYFSQKELAKLYTKINPDNAEDYYKEALKTAQKLNDSFKIALVYFESGEFFYDKEDDEHALNHFLKAKSALKGNLQDENIARINSRIKDIKMRLDSKIFNSIIEKYDR